MSSCSRLLLNLTPFTKPFCSIVIGHTGPPRCQSFLTHTSCLSSMTTLLGGSEVQWQQVDFIGPWFWHDSHQHWIKAFQIWLGNVLLEGLSADWLSVLNIACPGEFWSCMNDPSVQVMSQNVGNPAVKCGHSKNNNKKATNASMSKLVSVGFQSSW